MEMDHQLSKIKNILPKSIVNCMETSEPFASLKKIQNMLLISQENEEFFTKKIRTRSFLRIFITMSPLFLSALGHMWHCLSDDIVDEFFEQFVTMYCFLNVLGLEFLFLIYGDDVVTMMKRLNSAEFGFPEILRQEMIQTNTLVMILFLTDCFLTIFYSSFSFATNNHCLARRITLDSRYICGLVMPAWIPFANNIPGIQILAFLYTFFIVLLIIPKSLATAICCTSITRCISCRILDLKNQIEGCQKSPDLFEDRLEYFIDYYNEIARCSEKLNSSLGYCGIIVYPSSAVLLAIMEYSWIRTGQIFYLIFLVPVMGCTIILCLSGQYFENTHESLVESVENLPWYEMSPEMKRNYRIFLTQIQVPLRLKGQPLFNFNAQFFTYYVKGSYTLLNFFLNFKN